MTNVNSNITPKINYCYNCGVQVIDKSHKFCSQCGSCLHIDKPITIPNPSLTEPLPYHPIIMKSGYIKIKSQLVDNTTF